MLANIFYLVVYVAGIVLVVATLLPLWRTTRWWVRVLDFPRFQIAVLATGIAILLAAVTWPPQGIDAALLVVCRAFGWLAAVLGVALRPWCTGGSPEC